MPSWPIDDYDLERPHPARIISPPPILVSSGNISSNNRRVICKNLMPRDPETFFTSISSVSEYESLPDVGTICSHLGKDRSLQRGAVTPHIFQNPLLVGVDFVLHSATKYLGGRCAIVASVVIGNNARIKKLVAEEGCLLCDGRQEPQLLATTSPAPDLQLFYADAMRSGADPRNILWL